MKIKHLFFGLLFLLASSNVFAQHRGHGYHHNHYAYHSHHSYHRHHAWYPNYNWVLPTIVGGVVLYEMTRQPVSQPVIIQQPQPVIIQNTMPIPPYGYKWEYVYDYSCSCYKLVAVPF